MSANVATCTSATHAATSLRLACAAALRVALAATALPAASGCRLPAPVAAASHANDRAHSLGHRLGLLVRLAKLPGRVALRRPYLRHSHVDD